MSQQEPPGDYTADDRIEDELGPGEPDELVDDPDNAAAAEAIRNSTLEEA